MSDEKNADYQLINPHNFILWRTDCINHLNTVQSILANELSVSNSEDFNRIRLLLEDVISLNSRFIAFPLNSYEN